MNLVLQFDQSHPTSTAIIGGYGGLLAWFLAHSPEITSVAGAIGGTCAALLGVIAIVAKLINLSRAFVCWVSDTRHNRRHRRLHRIDPTEDDDLPF